MARKKTPGPKDLNELAADIVGKATGEPQPEEPEKDPKAVKRGKARADSLTPEERSEIAKKAARARWEDKRD